MTFGQAEAGSNGIFRLNYGLHRVLWIPDLAKELRTRVMVCATCRKLDIVGRRYSPEAQQVIYLGDDGERCSGGYVWVLCCVDFQAGGFVPQPLRDTTHGKMCVTWFIQSFSHIKTSEIDEVVDNRDGRWARVFVGYSGRREQVHVTAANAWVTGKFHGRRTDDLVQCVWCSYDVVQQQRHPFRKQGHTESGESPRRESPLQYRQQCLEHQTRGEDDEGGLSDGEGHSQPSVDGL